MNPYPPRMPQENPWCLPMTFTEVRRVTMKCRMKKIATVLTLILMNNYDSDLRFGKFAIRLLKSRAVLIKKSLVAG